MNARDESADPIERVASLRPAGSRPGALPVLLELLALFALFALVDRVDRVDRGPASSPPRR